MDACNHRLAFSPKELIDRFNCMAGIDHSRPATHQHCYPERGGELFPRGPCVHGVMYVVRDAVIAPMCDADCQCH